MKKFNLKDQALISEIKQNDQEIKSLLPLTERINKATVAILERKNGKTPHDLIGTGVLFKISTHYFLFTAAHVYKQKDCESSINILINNEPLFEITKSEWFASVCGKPGTHSDDPVDAAVCRILTDLPVNIKENALTLNDINCIDDKGEDTFFITGYPVSRFFRKTHHLIVARGTNFNTYESNESYDAYQINRKTHVATVYNKYAVRNFEQQQVLKPNGLSGGSIARIVKDQNTGDKRLVLSAIVTEHKPEQRFKPGCIIGSRVQYHLYYIWKYMPELANILDDANIF